VNEEDETPREEEEATISGGLADNLLMSPSCLLCLEEIKMNILNGKALLCLLQLFCFRLFDVAAAAVI